MINGLLWLLLQISRHYLIATNVAEIDKKKNIRTLKAMYLSFI